MATNPDAELLAALAAVRHFLERVLANHAALVEALAGGRSVSGAQLDALADQFEADRRELQRFTERVAQLHALARVH